MSLVDSSKHVKRKIRKGRPSGPWITARKIVQYLSLAVFILLFLLSKQGGWPGDLVNLPMRLDPLLMLSHLLSGRIFLLGSTLALLTLLATLVFGRAWCGWVCPLGTVLDIFPLNRWRGQRPAPAEAWRKLKYVLLLTTLIAALLGNLTLLVLDPLTILFRSLSVAIWPAIDQTVTAVERLLYQVPLFSEPVSQLDAWIRPAIFPTEPLFYRDTLLFACLLPRRDRPQPVCAALLVPLPVPAGWLARVGEQVRPIPARSRRRLQGLRAVHTPLPDRND